MTFKLATLALAALAVTAPASAEQSKGDEQLAKLLEGRVAGEPQKCITLSSVSSSQIVDETAIVYRIGSTLWVNRPDGGAESLDDDDILVIKTTGSRLCNIDTVELRDQGSRMYAGFVSLGDFVPYRRPRAD